jgi:hypothetical protein
MFERASTTDTTLVIRHTTESDPASFRVERLRDGRTSEPVSPPSPHGFPVEGRPNSDLVRELQWYLETFLDYPFPPDTEHADRVLKAMKDWGQQTFEALFGNRSGGWPSLPHALTNSGCPILRGFCEGWAGTLTAAGPCPHFVLARKEILPHP